MKKSTRAKTRDDCNLVSAPKPLVGQGIGTGVTRVALEAE
jgi:hypothetical protein